MHWYEGVRSLGTGVYTWLCAARTWQIFFKNSIYRTILACIPCWLVFVNLKQIQAIWEEGLSTEKIKWLPQIGLWAILTNAARGPAGPAHCGDCPWAHGAARSRLSEAWGAGKQRLPWLPPDSLQRRPVTGCSSHRKPFPH